MKGYLRIYTGDGKGKTTAAIGPAASGAEPAVQAHGSIPYAELRQLNIDPSDIIDFSATVNPFPLPESIKRLFVADGMAAYPDTDCFEARKALASFHDIPVEWTVMSAGMTEIIFAFPTLFKKAACLSPTYGDYEAAYKRHHRELMKIQWPRSEEDWRGFIENFRKEHFELLVICNPNNPTGDYLPPEKIELLCHNFRNVTLCIDESYQEMGEDCESALRLMPRYRNLIILKSLTKPYGIGGLRSGYAISSGGALKLLNNCLLPWAVSTLAQRIVPVLLRENSRFREQWKMILENRNKLRMNLLEKGFHIGGSRCPFFLVDIGDAERIRRELLSKHRFAVRSCASFGLPGFIRIMPGLSENNDAFVKALTDLHKAKNRGGI